MTDTNKTDKSSQADLRREKLAEQLRANLKRRKQQARKRALGHPADDSEGMDEKGRC